MRDAGADGRSDRFLDTGEALLDVGDPLADRLEVLRRRNLPRLEDGLEHFVRLRLGVELRLERLAHGREERGALREGLEVSARRLLPRLVEALHVDHVGHGVLRRVRRVAAVRVLLHGKLLLSRRLDCAPS